MKLKKIIKIVSLIDKDAAKYIKDNVLDGDYDGISKLFTWEFTPQGEKYWKELNTKVQAVINTVEFYK